MKQLPMLLSAAEQFADSPDPIDSLIAITICYFVARSEHLEIESGDVLARLGYVAAGAWEPAECDGARLIALPTLDRVLINASTGVLDLDARDLDEINQARIRAGKPFWNT